MNDGFVGRCSGRFLVAALLLMTSPATAAAFMQPPQLLWTFTLAPDRVYDVSYNRTLLRVSTCQLDDTVPCRDLLHEWLPVNRCSNEARVWKMADGHTVGVAVTCHSNTNQT